MKKYLFLALLIMGGLLWLQTELGRGGGVPDPAAPL